MPWLKILEAVATGILIILSKSAIKIFREDDGPA